MKNACDLDNGIHKDFKPAAAKRDDPAAGRSVKAAAPPPKTVPSKAVPSKTITALLADALRGASEYVTRYTAGRGAE